MARQAPRPDVVERIERAFDARGWRVFDYQREVWRAQAKGESGLIHAPTGTGKTLAAWLGLLADPRRHDQGLSVLWLTPMRALATDTTAGLQSACRDVGVDWKVEMRTGDTSSHVRARQRRQLPNALVTTPESASLLISYADLIPALSNLRAVIVDEWHELLGSKRGVQTELVLSRLRALSPGLKTWGVSATLGNLDQAMHALLGPGRKGRCVSAEIDKRVVIETLLPDVAERFPWSGHMGLGQAARVVEAIRRARTSLLFTNTRSQAERWFERLSSVTEPTPLRVAMHHGSLDPALRAAAEDGLRQGTLDAVVATSSLDLGVDFTPVDQVIQLGGPKGIARLLQRAGRSGHRPGQVSRIVCVPTQAIEIAEFAAAREAAAEGTVEARVPLSNALDVLAQHIVTLALTGRVTADEIRREIAATHAYAGLGEDEWSWVMDFVTRGGSALAAYPQYRKVAADADGFLHVPDATLARRHRMAVGTISSDPQVRVAFVRGSSLGTVEESFVSRLRPGDSFVFAGRQLTLVRVHEMVAQVKAGGGGTQVPRWLGGKSPLSSELSDRLLRLISEFDPTHAKRKHASRDPATVAELATLAPLLEIQSRWSGLPLPGTLLVERTRTREGEHLYCYPFAGRHAHEGLSALMAWRLSQRRRASFVFSVNDYGFELLSRELPDLEADEIRALFSPENLDADLVASINASEMARRRFREIARIAGLVFEGHPGQRKTMRQVQASSGLIFDTLTRYDPDNLLTKQALREALDHLLDVRRLRATAERLHASPVVLHRTGQLTPLAFPLWAERLSSQQLTSEDTRTRIERMLDALEIAAGGTRGPPLPPPLEAPSPSPRRERPDERRRPRRRRLRL